MSSDAATPADWWAQWLAAGDQYTDVVAETVDVQRRMVDAWLDRVEDVSRQEYADENATAAFRAYETWMDAAEDTVEQLDDLMEGEDVPAERFRDTWLTAANRAFQQAMRTTAFAHATGSAVEDASEFRQQLDDAAETALHEWGLATEGDVREVGERLVELERRQHAVEERLDRILDAVEEE